MVRYSEFRVSNRTVIMRVLVIALALAAALPAAGPSDAAVEVWQTLVLAATRAASSGDFKSAEELLQRAARQAGAFPPGDPRPGTTQNTMGLVYREEKKYGEAQKAFERALAILEKVYGPQSLDVANIHYNLASVMIADGNYEKAIPYLQQSRTIYIKIMGAGSLKAAGAYCLLGESYRNMKKFAEAEAPLKECADMREASGGVENPDLADALYNLALVYEHQGKFNMAEPRFRLAAKIRELTLGVTSPAFADALEAHSAILKTMGKAAESDKVAALAASIRRNEKK